MTGRSPSRVVGALHRAGLLHSRIRLPGLVLATAVAMFMLQRLALLAIYRERFAGIPWIQIAHGFAIGFRFDLVVAGMLVVPLMPIMFLAPQRLIESRSFKLAVGTLLGGLLGLPTLRLAVA